MIYVRDFRDEHERSVRCGLLQISNLVMEVQSKTSRLALSINHNSHLRSFFSEQF